MAAQSRHADDAFEHLEHAAALGYKDVDSMRIDDDLKTLRGDARFHAESTTPLGVRVTYTQFRPTSAD
jgi:hypothetical protein